MMIRFGAHEAIAPDERWTARDMPLVGFASWFRIWRADLAIEIEVLGQWTPAHIVLATEIIPSLR